MSTFTVSHDARLEGDVDLDAVLATIARGVTIRGLFFLRYVKAISTPWSSVSTRLEAPPRGGDYHALARYPLGDYQILLDIAARERAGSASATREAYRLLGRGEVEVFASTSIGKVAMTMMREPGAALVRYPEVITLVLEGVGGVARRKGDQVTITFARFTGAIESTVGTLEAMVLMFDRTPKVDVTVDGPSVTFVVRW
jgi:uncharacterized protein (TIGR02265 family)